MIRGVAFFDVDNTLFDGYSTSDFYLYIAEKTNNQEIFARDAEIGQAYRVDKSIDYHEATLQVIDLFAATVRGLSVDDVAELSEQYLADNSRVFAFVPALFNLLREYGFEIALVSAGTRPNIEAIQRFCRADAVYATEIEVHDGVYTGTALHVLNGSEKTALVREMCGKDDLTFGFGDSTGDVPMLEAVDRAFVINCHQTEMEAMARSHDWQLVDELNIVEMVEHTLKQLKVIPPLS